MLENLGVELLGISVELKELRKALTSQQKPAYSDELGGRVAELEVKMAKLWTMLTTVTPNGQEKLSKVGKRFGGKSRHLLS